MLTVDEKILHLIHKTDLMSMRGPRQNGSCPPPPPSPNHRGGCVERARGRLMATLKDLGPQSQIRLAEILDVRPQSLSEMLSKIEADGLIERAPSAEDKRQVIVSLSAEGERRIDEFRSYHKQKATELLSPLNEEEKENLLALLEKLTEARKEEDKKEDE